MKHSDTITSSAGDALAYNKVVHIDDPWPRASGNTRITGKGQRVDTVTKRYLSGSGASSGAPAPSVLIPIAPPPAGSPPAQ